jgi:outer membrane protein OmpA-like peptidoglycan-associated protein
MTRLVSHAYLRRALAAFVILSFVATGLVGCSNLSNTEKGAVIGAGGGAAAGAIIGEAAADASAKGAILGAIVGGTAGAIIGQRMDRQAEELDRELEGAEVTRVGEGIQVTFDSALLFPLDSAELQPTARRNLGELASTLKDYPDTELLIVGHTDSQGSERYNERLSERRAESAALYLYEQGIEPSRLKTLGKGEREPVASNATAEGRQQNRRVEVAIYASEEMREDAREQARSSR